MSAWLSIAILVGVLAAADPFVLERVELNRLRFGGELAGPGVLKLALEDCRWLGHRALVFVGRDVYPARVVDCQQAEHRAAFPMSGRGIVADISGDMAKKLNHKRATVVVVR